jgi:hypothetical protein
LDTSKRCLIGAFYEPEDKMPERIGRREIAAALPIALAAA